MNFCVLIPKYGTTYGPCWRIVIISTGQLSPYTANFTLAYNSEVIVIDSRNEYAEELNQDDVIFINGMPDDVLLGIWVD